MFAFTLEIKTRLIKFITFTLTYRGFKLQMFWDSSLCVLIWTQFWFEFWEKRLTQMIEGWIYPNNWKKACFGLYFYKCGLFHNNRQRLKLLLFRYFHKKNQIPCNTKFNGSLLTVLYQKDWFTRTSNKTGWL